MSGRANAGTAPKALELVEEAIHFLRANPGTLAPYCLGAFPFVLGFLYFFAELSRGAYGFRHAAIGSLGMAILFLWLKCWQTIFARQVRAAREGARPEPLTAGQMLRMVIVQAAVQPSGLFLIPVAIAIGLPFGWVAAFYNNFTVYGDGRDAGLRAPLDNALRETARWPGQNHLVLLILHSFGLIIFINVVIVLTFIPDLIKTLLGIETLFTRSGLGWFNSTLFATAFALTYLALDPIVKTAYLLRCFYGEAIVSGRDLQVELRRITGAALAALLLAMGMAWWPAAPAAAEPAPTVTLVPAAVTPAELDRAIAEVISEPEYSWKLPRVAPPATTQELTWFEKFMDEVLTLLKDAVKAVLEWVRKGIRWLLRHLPKVEPPKPPELPGFGWLPSVQTVYRLLFVLLGAVLLGLAIYSWRQYRKRKRTPPVVAEPVAAVPDLTAETVTADALPVERWLALARELAARGELRLALRAYYLAGLARLAQQNLLTIARSKSNRDYWRELRRRAHALPGMLTAFEQTMLDFERVWYGDYPVDSDQLERFAATQQVFWSNA